MASEKKVLNLRSCPADLIWKAKEAAAAERMTLTQFVVDAIRYAVERHNVEAASNAWGDRAKDLNPRNTEPVRP